MKKVKNIHFEKLSRLEDLEISFPETGLVAIMGANGTGKSTILHAMACLYKPDAKITLNQENYKWSRYFIPHGKSLWMGSTVKVTFYDDNKIEVYSKGSDRWTPQYSRRESRFVRFIGIGDYYPHLEKERYHNQFKYSTVDINEKIRDEIRDLASYILNKKYNIVKRAIRYNGTQKKLWFVETETESYTSLYMGGGEQKVFHILEMLLTTPKGGLILIEEIEVLMHDLALRKLLEVMESVAKKKELQLVFSTHWTGVVKLKRNIKILTLVDSKEGIRLIEGFDANSVFNISGDPADKGTIKVWVEDSVSKSIIRQISADLGISNKIDIKLFGDASNAFTIAASIILSGSPADSIVIIDGDVYETFDKKISQMRKTLSGSNVQTQQMDAVSIIYQYTPSKIMNPEEFLISTINIDDDHTSSNLREFKLYYNNNILPDEGKLAMLRISEEFNVSLDYVITIIVQHASKQPAWISYTSDIKNRLSQLAAQL